MNTRHRGIREKACRDRFQICLNTENAGAAGKQFLFLVISAFSAKSVSYEMKGNTLFLNNLKGVIFMSRITKLLISCLFMFLFLIVSSISVMAELKIGYIQPTYIFENYEPYKEAQRQLMEFQKTEEDKLQKEGEKLRQNVEDAQKRRGIGRRRSGGRRSHIFSQ